LQIDSLKAVVFTAAFLMPGFIWSAVLSVLLPGRTRQTETKFLEFFTLSCINNALWFWLFAYFIGSGLAARRTDLFSGFLLIALFISPLILGAVSGHLSQKEYGAKFLRGLGFRTIHPIPTAWDWHFSRQERLWVRITLKNSSTIYGLFGFESFASSDPAERDVYLEQVFRQTTEGFECIKGTRGCLVKGDEISVIEFYRAELE
jgi:hypothetical protein